LRVSVKYIANIYKVAKKKDEDFELANGSSLKDFVDVLIMKYGPAMREEILGPDNLICQDVFVLVNGTETHSLGLKLKDGDVVVISPVVSGG
jgi:MoaD family protein